MAAQKPAVYDEAVTRKRRADEAFKTAQQNLPKKARKAPAAANGAGPSGVNPSTEQVAGGRHTRNRPGFETEASETEAS